MNHQRKHFIVNLQLNYRFIHLDYFLVRLSCRTKHVQECSMHFMTSTVIKCAPTICPSSRNSADKNFISIPNCPYHTQTMKLNYSYLLCGTCIVFGTSLIYLSYRSSSFGYAHWTTFSKEILAGNPLRRSQISPADLQRSLILERVQSLESACDSADLSAYQFNFYQVTSRFYVDKQANLSYCKVPKAGSSFMTEIFFALDKDEKNNSKNSILKSKSIDEIFEMSRNRVHMIGNSKLGATPMLNDKELNTTVLLVSRNPYSRLYSAYVDKFYLFGLVKTAMEISNKNKKRHSSCGYDVTFPEFLDHVITTAYGGYPINRHWAPVYLLCHACDVKYDVVSKMDTLSNDMESILDYTNVSYSTRSSLINIIHRKYENKTAISLINVYIKSWNQYKKLCPAFLEYLSKIWKSFKIQGKLRIDLLFPKRKFAKAIKGEINVNEVIAIFLEYMTKYKMTSGERKLQRRRALVKAFSTVSEETITKIQELYKLDFMLFQYDTSPPTVV